MTPTRRRNIIVSPIVIFIRLPLLLPLWCLSRLGWLADTLGDKLACWLPGWRYEGK